MRTIIAALNSTMALVLMPLPALAYCSEPSTSISLPDAPGSYVKPDVPPCLASYAFSGEHTCNEWELSSYQSEVEDYICWFPRRTEPVRRIISIEN
jgi:hypothetical protein